MKLVYSFEVSWCIWILQCIGLIIVTRYAPLENRNKKLNVVQKEKNRNIAVTLYLIFIFISIVMSIVEHKVYYVGDIYVKVTIAVDEWGDVSLWATKI